MSDFLLVVPECWVQIDLDYACSQIPDLNMGNVDNWISTSQFNYIEVPLKQLGLIPENKTVVSAKRFEDYFAVLLG